MTRLTHVSETILEQLRTEVPRNLDRYRGSGFVDLVREPGWSIDLTAAIDVSGLEELDGTSNRADSDFRNSQIVARALHGVSASLANEERIWVRLSHVEAFAYSRDRWLRGVSGDAELTAAVSLHLFARTQTALRDDHSVARLWWNWYVAKHCYPQDPDRGLALLLTTADVRSNIVERIWLTGRRKLASGVFRSMERDGFVLQSEESFRGFMKALNLLGGGVVFEALEERQIDAFLDRCSEHAAGNQGLQVGVE